MVAAVDSKGIKTYLSYLGEMRGIGGAAQCTGLNDDRINYFLTSHRDLGDAIERAYDHVLSLKKSDPDFVALDEAAQVRATHAGLTNFYTEDTVNPYVAAGAAGPWVISLKGAVVYDCGGYGMLGLGHAPPDVLAAMNQSHVMANIMTGSASQRHFVASLRSEIGHTRTSGNPYASFLCVNSGSEAMSVASRLADVNTHAQTGAGGQYAGWDVRGLSLRHSFHGRTDRPARYSDSTIRTYKKHLASYADSDYLWTVDPNDIDGLEAVFARARDERVFIEAFFMEPVMGEGDPGMAITPDFYARARDLTRQHGSMFVVDSIQAGLRAHGVLSIVDYPGFQNLAAPDMEAYSKALNAGQYPLSVLALSQPAAAMYRHGLYGNTMTSNPRALDVAVAVLRGFDDERRENIRRRGKELVARFEQLAKDTGDAITNVQGTGLLLSCELNSRYKIYGANSSEDYLRRQGLGVIHGGAHSLRYTPVFDLGDDEVDLIVEMTRDALLNGPGS